MVKNTAQVFKYSLIGLFAMLAIGAPFAIQKLRLYGAELSARLIIELVRHESNEYYNISYQSAQLSFIDRSLDISGLLLSPDTAWANANGEPLPVNSFEILIPQLHISIESFIALFFYEELKIRSIKIVDPAISMFRTNEPSAKRPFSLEAGDLYVIISQYLKLFKIERFNIHAGSFAFDKANNALDSSKFNIKSLDFSIQNMLIDSKASSDRGIFFSESIDLIIHDQVIYLSDSIHQFSFDKLTISTGSELILFEGVNIRPMASARASFDDNPDHFNLYDISVPSLQLRGVDFMKAYTNNLLEIEDINVVSPEIRLYDGVNAKRKSTKPNSLSALLIDYFDEVKVRNISVQQGNLDLKVVEGAVSQDFRLSNANILLENFNIDSRTFDKSGSFDYFEHLELTFSDYTYNLADSVHALYIGGFQLSTKSGIIATDNIKLLPRSDAKHPERQDEYSIESKSVILEGFDWQTLANKRTLQFTDLLITDPRVRIKRVPTLVEKREGSKVNLKGFGDQVLKVLNELSFQMAKVDNGSVHILEDDEELLGLENIFLSMEDFKVNENTMKDDDLWFFSKDIDLRFSDFDIELPDRSHIIYLDRFMLNTRKKIIQLSNASIKPLQSSPLAPNYSFSGGIERLIVHGLSMTQLLQHHHVVVDSIALISPSLEIVDHGQEVNIAKKQESNGGNEWLKYLIIKYLKVSNGKLSLSRNERTLLSVGNYQLTMQGLALDSVMLQDSKLDHFISDLAADANQVMYIDESSGHQLKVDRFSMSQKTGDLLIRGVNISPVPSMPGQFKLNYSSDRWHARGLRIDKLLTGKGFELQELLVPKAILAFSQNANKTRPSVHRTPLGEIYTLLAERFSLLKSDKLHFDTLAVDLRFGENIIASPNVGLKIGDLHIDQNQGYDVNVKPFFGHISFSADRPSVQIASLPFAIVLAKASWQTQGGLVTFDSLKFNPKSYSEVSTNIVFPKINIVGLDLAKMWDENVLEAGGLQLIRPEVSLVQYASAEKNADGLPEAIHLPWHHLKLDTLMVDWANFHIIAGSNTSGSSFMLNNISLQAKGIYMDSTHKLLGNKLFYSDRLVVTGENFNLPIQDSINSLLVGKYEIESPSGNLALTELKIWPNHEKYALGAYLGKQTDWMKGEIEYLKVNGLNIRKLLQGKGIEMSLLDITGMEMAMFRDKRHPFPEDQLRALPHMALMQSGQPIEIDQVNLQRGKVTYEEFAEEGTEVGSIFFDDIEARISNVVNTPLKLSANKTLNANIVANLMGEAKVVVGFKAFLPHEAGEFTLTGKVGPFDLKSINQMLEHVAFLKLRSGQNEGIEMRLTGNNTYSMGEMRFEYKNLKINLLSKDTSVHSSLGHAIGSFFANTFIVRSNNPNFLLLRKGDIYFERDPAKSIFNYWSKSFLSGVVSSIGAKSNKRYIKKKNKENLRINKDRMREEKYLEDKIGIYD